MPYAPLDDSNHEVLTLIGTIKSSYGLPQTMAAGARALANRSPCLIVDFRGLREFSATQLVAAQASAWPGLRHATIEFPGARQTPELYSAHLAVALEDGGVRERVITTLRPLLEGPQAVGFPAVLGLGRARDVHAAFEEGLGLPVFEVPTPPTSVPGLRLLGALERALATRNVARRQRAWVGALEISPGNTTAVLHIEGTDGDDRVVARNVVLATGRFGGRGLTADREAVRESLLGLQVVQPDAREHWHQEDFFARSGHPVNRAGVLVDECWRALEAPGKHTWDGLFAIGSILAHQDWMRSKSGSGLAIATAWAAVEQIVQRREGRGGR